MQNIQGENLLIVVTPEFFLFHRLLSEYATDMIDETAEID
jgi:hypothetical protein